MKKNRSFFPFIPLCFATGFCVFVRSPLFIRSLICLLTENSESKIYGDKNYVSVASDNRTIVQISGIPLE